MPGGGLTSASTWWRSRSWSSTWSCLFLYPWAVAAAGRGRACEPRRWRIGHGLRPRLVFAGVVVFFILLRLGFVYDWRKGLFRWR